MAITRLFTRAVSVNFLTDTPARINTSGYKSAKVVISIVSPSAGALSFGFKGDTDAVNIPFYNEKLGWKENMVIDYRGGNFQREFLIDLSSANSCKLNFSKSSFDATSAKAEIYFSYAEIPPIASVKAFDLFNQGALELDITNRLFRITLSREGVSEGNSELTSNVSVVVNLYDGESWTGNEYFLIDGVETNSIQVGPTGKYSFWLNTEAYQKIRIKVNTGVYYHIAMNYEVEQLSSFERKVNAISTNNPFSKCGGGKYLKLLFNGMTVTNGAGQIRIFAKDADGNFMEPRLYTLDGKAVKANVLSDVVLKSSVTSGGQTVPCTIFHIFGDHVNGGIILKYDRELSSESSIGYSFPSSQANKIIVNGETPSYTKSLSFEISNEMFSPVESVEDKIVTRRAYDIVNLNISGKVVDALNEDILVKIDTNTFKYCRFGLHGIIYDVVLDSAHCPSLMQGEEVKFVKLINYEDVSFTFSMTRILLFTTKNRILYNRVKNDTTGISFFREAPLYNLKKRFYPVNDKALASSVAKYLPIFPEYDYNQFEGRIDGTDEFGLALPTRGSSVGTLLEDWRRDDEIGKVAYSTFVISNAYGCVFGQYNSADGDPWVAVSDNGKAFYIIETWASVEDYLLRGITTMKVDLSTIITNAGGYTSGSLKATRRQYNVPTEQIKEPATPFIIGPSCVIDSITVEGGRTYLSFVDDSAFRSDEITTHKFDSMAPIIFIENISANAEYDYICNNVAADGSGNTGVYFRLHRVATNTYELFGDVGDPFEEKLVCRHIHSVSESYGGFLIATGENYRHIQNEPFFDGGFLYFITADRKIAARPLQYTLEDVASNFYGTFRITSSEKAINRACGAVLRGDKKIIFVSDDVQGDRDVNDISIEGRTEKMGCKSYGVYMGDIQDSDDWSKFVNVCNMYDAGLGLVEHQGRLAVCGYAGPIYISPDFGNTWFTENVSRKYRSNPEQGSILDVTGIDNNGSFYYGNNRIDWKV